MSKTKEALLKEQDNLMAYYIGFYEWLEKFQPKLGEADINNMEKESKASLSSKASNNPNYIPKGVNYENN